MMGMSYTHGMKAAVSIPDDVFRDAERLAAELKTSRSQLYARAIREFVARHSSERVTAALDAVYEVPDSPDDSGFVRTAAERTLERAEW